MTLNLNRRQFGIAAAATGLSASIPSVLVFGQSTEIKLKYGTAFSADHPGTLRIR